MDIQAYYEERVAHFDDERKQISDYVGLVTMSKKEKHMLDWDNR